MRIAETDLSLSSQATQWRRQTASMGARVWVGARSPDAPPSDPAVVGVPARSGLLPTARSAARPLASPSTAAGAIAVFEANLVSVQLEQSSAAAPTSTTTPNAVQRGEPSEVDDASLDVRTRMLMSFVWAVTGRRIALFRMPTSATSPNSATPAPGGEASRPGAASAIAADSPRVAASAIAADSPRVAASAIAADSPRVAASAIAADSPRVAAVGAPEWGIEIHAERTTVHGEQTQFAAEGAVTTQNGKKIAFRLDLTMSQETVVIERFDLVAGSARPQDPLALNFQGTAVSFGQGGATIDLNGDGSGDLLRALAPGSAWLVRDLNGDGRLTDRAELFGPATGDGFADLGALDADRNGWVDEGDPAFSQLATWSGQEGADLVAIEERGVAAISTKGIATPFALRDANGTETGRIRSTGVWLSEDGQPGAIQQIDVLT